MKGTALITGAGKRIGRALAIALAERGYKIAVHYYHSREDADATLDAVRDVGSGGKIYRCDLQRSTEIEKLVSKIIMDFPDLCVLINNASIFKRADIIDTDLDLFDQNMNVHVKAPFLLTQSFANMCKKGQIINLLDTKIHQNLTSYFAYSLSKKCLYDLTLLSAKGLAPHIRVNGIAPGLILPAAGDSKDKFEKMGQKIPLRQTGDVKHIVSAALLLLENEFITGEVIHVDGGEHLLKESAI